VESSHGWEPHRSQSVHSLASNPVALTPSPQSKVTIDALRRFRKRCPNVKVSFRASSAYGLHDRWSLTLDKEWRIRKVSFREKANDDDLALFAQNSELAGVQYILLPYPQAISGKGLVHLKRLNNLKTLILDECKIGDEGLEAIGGLAKSLVMETSSLKSTLSLPNTSSRIVIPNVAPRMLASASANLFRSTF
jgi:hypothetical protein